MEISDILNSTIGSESEHGHRNCNCVIVVKSATYYKKLRRINRILNEFNSEFQAIVVLGNYYIVPHSTQRLCVVIIVCNVVRIMIICR